MGKDGWLSKLRLGKSTGRFQERTEMQQPKAQGRCDLFYVGLPGGC